MTILRYTVVALIIGVGLLLNPETSFAQRQGGQAGQQQAQQAERAGPPLIVALDANGDSVISAEEIANAYQSLKALDRNGDGELAADEFRPAGAPGQGQRPGGAQGGGQGQGQRPGGAQGGAQGQRGQGQGPRGGAQGGGQGQGPRGGAQGGGQGQRGGGQMSVLPEGVPPSEVNPRDLPDRPRDIRLRNAISVGSPLPDTLNIYNTTKELIPLKQLFRDRPTVVVCGCLTCPAFLTAYPEIEAVYADYKDKADFYFLYHVLAHPENRGYIQPMTIDERFMHIEEAKRTLGTKVPWIADTMNNELKELYVFASNPEFIFAPDGTVVHREPWSRGTTIREQLEKLVGPSATTTTVEQLGLPKLQKVSEGDRSGIVERIQVNGVAAPLKFSPGESTDPYYAKLRPEADQQLVNSGSGQMYIGFHLDPIHQVKWNNLAAPLKFELTGPDGVVISPAGGEAKKQEVESDGDPREFLVDIQNWNTNGPLTLKAYYFACHKTDNWCKPVTQEYTIYMESDPAAGRVNGRTHKAGGAGAGGGRGQGGRGKGVRGQGGRDQGVEIQGRGGQEAQGVKSQTVSMRQETSDQGAGQGGRGQGAGGQGGRQGRGQGQGAGGQGGRGQGAGGRGQGGRGQGQGQGGQRQRPPRTPIVVTEGQLPDTDAHLPDGTPIKVRDLIKGKYTVIKTGCMTCPEFLISYKELEALAADYTKKDVQFYYIYQSLRHPEREGYVQPQNTKERLMHVAEAKKRLGTKVPWIMDTIDDSFRVAMRTNSNSVFVISPDSEIVYAADRMNGDGFRKSLGDIVGPVENPTSAADLNFPEIPRFPPTNITNEIRVERPQGLVILKATPTKPEDTYFVKLRAEAEKSVLENGKGDLYLGFFPDPIHDAHWNNLTPAMKYELELPDGVTIDPPTAQANKGPGDSDTEPRQFKLKVDCDGTPGDIKLKIHYYACTPGMCEGMTHEYQIAFEDMNRNSRTYSFNRGQGSPGGIPKPTNRQFGPGRAGGGQGAQGGRGQGGAGQGGGGQRGQGGRGGAGQGGQRGGGQGGRGGAGQGAQGAQGGAGQGAQGRGAGSGGQRGQGSRGGGPRDKVRPRDVEFNEKFPVGAQLPADLKLYDVDRNLVPATSVLKSKYTVIVGGCLTCPAYRSSYPEIEAVARDFSDRGVNFYFLYQTLAHPENWGFVQPSSIDDRFAQVEHAKQLLQTKIPWLTDPIDNQMKTYFVGTPNSQLVFDQSGKVVHRDSWGRGSSLRESLESLVGKPDTLTTVADLNLPKFEHHLKSESDMLLKRVKVEGVAVPLQVNAGGESAQVEKLRSSDFGESNRYAKLRAEADQNLISTGTGQLYLGFRQDPVLGAKWNNLAAPPAYKIEAEGATFSPATAESTKLEIESDDEPREFLVDVKDWKVGQRIVVKIQYFACNKEKGWCKPVQQEFTVELQKDDTAGMVNGRTHFPNQRGAGGQGGGGRGQGGRGQGAGGRGQGQGGRGGQGGRRQQGN